MMVLMTSCTLRRVRSHPAIQPQIAPPVTPTASIPACRHTAGQCSPMRASAVAASAPIRSCPCAPMLNRPARQAITMLRLVSRRGVVCTRVAERAYQWPSSALPNAPSHSVCMAFKGGIRSTTKVRSSRSARPTKERNPLSATRRARFQSDGCRERSSPWVGVRGGTCEGDDLSRQPSLWKRALLVALRGFLSFVGLALLLLLTFVVLRIPPLKAMQTLWEGAFGSAEEGHWYALSATLVQTTPLLLTSLSIVIAWRAGLFSIGAQGQLLIGALAATALARIGEHWPAVCLQAGMLAVGVTGGAIWGWIAGWLRTRRNVQEVISTIMLNYIAQYLVSWLILGILREKDRKSVV